MVYEFMEEQQIPGITLAIVQAPYITRVAGYGLSDIGQQRLASTKTVWNVGPMSQGYAAVAIVQLFELGKINLKDKASKYLPDLPSTWNGITILQLLQHASGIPDYRSQSGYDASKNQSSGDLITMVKDIPLAFAPGTDVARSATNFLLLALIVEKASGVPTTTLLPRTRSMPWASRTRFLRRISVNSKRRTWLRPVTSTKTS